MVVQRALDRVDMWFYGFIHSMAGFIQQAAKCGTKRELTVYLRQTQLKTKNSFIMKRIKILAVATILTATSLISSASTTKAPARAEKTGVSLIEKMPVNIVVKQTASLKDGRTVTIYYQKEGGYVEVFSDSDLKGYTVDDLLNLESTTFTLASSVKGTSIFRMPVSKACSLLKQMVNLYL